VFGRDIGRRKRHAPTPATEAILTIDPRCESMSSLEVLKLITPDPYVRRKENILTLTIEVNPVST
jgi:hypothetical protein